MEQGWKEYFVFSKRERWAILLLFTLIILIWGIHFLNPVKKTPLKITWTSLDSIQEKMDGLSSGKKNYDNLKKDLEGADSRKLFPFDPNTASMDEWKVLGLTEKQAKIIQNYISKGGRFRKAEDLLKIYGLRSEDAERLMPFVQIRQADRPPSYSYQSGNNFYKKDRFRGEPLGAGKSGFPDGNKVPYNNSNYSSSGSKSGSGYYKKSNSVIEINSAGTEELESLPGIGVKLAERIIKFRDRLGGFHQIEQVAETFGLEDSVFQKIRNRLSCVPNIKKIPINSIGFKELSAHPYFRGKLPGLLINYREEHGSFTTMEDLSKVPMINDQVLGKIRPYISLEEKNNQ